MFTMASLTGRHVVRTSLLLAALLVAACSHGGSSAGLGALPKAVGVADEGFAIQALRMIATAQTQAKTTRGSYADFDALVQNGFLDQRFSGATPSLKGYRFSLTASENDFFVNADPQAVNTGPTNGGRHLYLDSTDNSIHVNSAQPATRADPLL